jgi:hypothetical protein
MDPSSPLEMARSLADQLAHLDHADEDVRLATALALNVVDLLEEVRAR